VDRFLSGAMPFLSIPKLIEKILKRHRIVARPGLREILEADRWARQEAEIV